MCHGLSSRVQRCQTLIVLRLTWWFNISYFNTKLIQMPPSHWVDVLPAHQLSRHYPPLDSSWHLEFTYVTVDNKLWILIEVKLKLLIFKITKRRNSSSSNLSHFCRVRSCRLFVVESWSRPFWSHACAPSRSSTWHSPLVTSYLGYVRVFTYFFHLFLLNLEL